MRDDVDQVVIRQFYEETNEELRYRPICYAAHTVVSGRQHAGRQCHTFEPSRPRPGQSKRPSESRICGWACVQPLDGIRAELRSGDPGASVWTVSADRRKPGGKESRDGVSERRGVVRRLRREDVEVDGPLRTAFPRWREVRMVLLDGVERDVGESRSVLQVEQHSEVAHRFHSSS